MRMHYYRVISLSLVALAILVGVAAAQAVDSRPAVVPLAVVPLAVVGPDTLTTSDLDFELDLLRRSTLNTGGVTALPDADLLLQRMIENRLLVQEGYRQGLDKNFIVSNRVKEAVRGKCVAALLDSIAWSVPADSVNSLAARKAGVNHYLNELMTRYDVRVDSTVLRGLDFGSSDPAVYKAIRESDDVLAVLPTGKLVVSSFYQVLLFDEFHGLSGKPNADKRRDKAFQDWLFESLLTYEVRKTGMDQRPKYRRLASGLERTLVGEEALNGFLDTPFDPSPDEVADFYQQNIGLVTPPPSVKLKSVMLTGKDPADLFRSRLQQGAKFGWLVKNTPEVVSGSQPFAEDWQAPSKVGLQPEEATVGFTPEPMEFPGGGYVVAVVSEVAPQAPLSLEQCRPQILAYMKKIHVQDTMAAVMKRLRAATKIQVLPGAGPLVSRIVTRTLTPAAAPGDEAGQSPTAGAQE